MLFVTWAIMGLNLLLHQGWMGAFGQVIAGDFIMFFSTGMIYRSNPNLIYDYQTQSTTQQSLVTPTVLPGYNPFMNPPFVAPFYSLLTFISINWSLILWTILALVSVILSILMMKNLVAGRSLPAGLTSKQLIILTLSFFPFIEGLQAGQNHWLTLLLVTGIIYCMFHKRWYLSGILAGCLLYKPQFVVGFLILWLIWKKFKALLSFAAVAIGWAGLFALMNGFDLYKTYLQLNQVFMRLPYIPGFPNYLMITIYGLLTSFLPAGTQQFLSILSEIFFIVCAIAVAWFAFRLRKRSLIDQTPILVFAIVFPLLASPYALLHDMVILIPVFALWAYYSASRELLYSAIIVYLGAFILTFAAALTHIAWVSLLVIGLSIAVFVWLVKNKQFEPEAAAQ